jgi:DNA-binding transcriptional MerR regulator
MLRYIENAGLIELSRSSSGYRLFGAEQLQRLRTLRELLAQFDCALSDVAFAERLRTHEELRTAVERWFEERPERPEGVTSNDWLRWEQDKHQRLIQPDTTRLRETAA